MPNKVTFDIPEHDLGTVPADFQVYKGKTLLGRLKIGRGGLRWYDGHASAPKKTITWSKFVKMIHDQKGHEVKAVAHRTLTHKAPTHKTHK